MKGVQVRKNSINGGAKNSGGTSVRQKGRLPLIAATALVIVLFCSGTAWAFNTFNGHVLNGGVGDYGANDRYYFITSSASAHVTDVTSAMSDWIHTTSRLGITTPIAWLRTTTQSQSVMDIYHAQYYDVSTGIIAATEQILNNVIIDPYGSNWHWAKIKLNTPVYDPLSDYNEEGSVAHEMGHVFGLAHTSVTNRIMCQLGDGRTVNNCQADDANGINYLY
jgi:Matrixin